MARGLNLAHGAKLSSPCMGLLHRSGIFGCRGAEAVLIAVALGALWQLILPLLPYHYIFGPVQSPTAWMTRPRGASRWCTRPV